MDDRGRGGFGDNGGLDLLLWIPRTGNRPRGVGISFGITFDDGGAQVVIVVAVAPKSRPAKLGIVWVRGTGVASSVPWKRLFIGKDIFDRVVGRLTGS